MSIILPLLQAIPRESLVVWGFSFHFHAILRHRLAAFLHKTKAINRIGRALFYSVITMCQRTGYSILLSIQRQAQIRAQN